MSRLGSPLVSYSLFPEVNPPPWILYFQKTLALDMSTGRFCFYVPNNNRCALCLLIAPIIKYSPRDDDIEEEAILRDIGIIGGARSGKPAGLHLLLGFALRLPVVEALGLAVYKGLDELACHEDPFRACLRAYTTLVAYLDIGEAAFGRYGGAEAAVCHG